jgi:hypothetical protein
LTTTVLPERYPFPMLPLSNFMDFGYAANNSGTTSLNSDDLAVVRQGDSALASAKRNFSYLINPTRTADHPERLRTRALLRTLNYVGRFIFWRIVRYAKYVAIGSLVAAVGATAFGSVISGVAWIAAPTSFGAGIIAAIVWYFGKWGAHRVQREWGRSRTKQDDEGIEENLEVMDSPVRRGGTWQQQTGPRVVPW